MGRKVQFLSTAAILASLAAVSMTVSADETTGYTMYRLYNGNSGEHFYTKDKREQQELINAGWSAEGTGWYGPESGSPVYRLYNKNAGDHHYTMSAKEKNELVQVGWSVEGIGWYSPKEEYRKTVPLYREYNPNVKAGSHNYILSDGEHKNLVNLGWKDEGIAWYGLATNAPVFEGMSYYDGTSQYNVSYEQTLKPYKPLDEIKAYDFFGNELKVKLESNVDAKKPGVYKETYTATDSLNQSTIIKRDVTITKVFSPEIRYDTYHSVNVNETIDLLDGVSAKDYAGKSLKVNVLGTVDTSKKGYYYIRYSEVDEFGNETIEKSTVQVY
ncbi:hypothetical protein IGK74_001330 [Enterococcus sp. AZ150]|uniref:Pesticidal crystal protein Cry22Aa Ig-like domain-containing protein n=1 Tax=Enterococcus sulfureus ATCC 49903 TaxID=1140003 RepID=S0P016_9ENTE|nr:immunoglobulin-like domain-containing protein [Enterococcus sulfureus]EOT49300.1 hypothetical protein OMY_00228 [Enterococcus sulfureus ATCC 49903]EOT87167.1 hypothetical protein I573_00223 [Enterococcus sulfureus ATCC 49903]